MMVKIMLWILLSGGVLGLMSGCYYEPYGAYESAPYAYRYSYPERHRYVYRYDYSYPYRYYSYYGP